MNEQEFQKVIDTTIKQVLSTMAAKGVEYVPEEVTSRFHNFEVSAALNQQLPTEALWGFLTKHIVSLSDMVKVPPTESSMAKWDEKINDAIIYLLLLKGIATEAHIGDSASARQSEENAESLPKIVVNITAPVLPPTIIHI